MPPNTPATSGKAFRVVKQTKNKFMMMKFRTSLEFPGESTVARSTRSGLGGSAPPQGPPGTYCRWDKHGSAHLMMGRWRHKTRLYEYVACVMARLMWASDELHAKLINVISKTIDPSTPPGAPGDPPLSGLSARKEEEKTKPTRCRCDRSLQAA